MIMNELFGGREERGCARALVKRDDNSQTYFHLRIKNQNAKMCAKSEIRDIFIPRVSYNAGNE